MAQHFTSETHPLQWYHVGKQPICSVGCMLWWWLPPGLTADGWAEQLARRHTYVYCCCGHGPLTKPGMQNKSVTILFDSRIMCSKSCLQYAISSKNHVGLWCGVISSRFIPMVGFQALWFGSSSWESSFVQYHKSLSLEQWSLYICSSNSHWQLQVCSISP